jgi:hypothetical protein
MSAQLEVVGDAEVEVLDTLDALEARRLTDEAKAEARALWRKLFLLHERGAHTALEYSSWKEYCEAEFGMAPTTAQNALDAGRVVAALESEVAPATSQLPSQKVARDVLAPLLPPQDRQGGGLQRNGSEERVAAAWGKIVAEHEATAEDSSKPITASFAKKVLVKAGMLPDTSATTHKPGWHELLGEVGDKLIAAAKKLDRFDAAIGNRKPSAALQEKAARYEQMAHDLAQRLRALREG